jgi:hypothetical protein
MVSEKEQLHWFKVLAGTFPSSLLLTISSKMGLKYKCKCLKAGPLVFSLNASYQAKVSMCSLKLQLTRERLKRKPHGEYEYPKLYILNDHALNICLALTYLAVIEYIYFVFFAEYKMHEIQYYHRKNQDICIRWNLLWLSLKPYEITSEFILYLLKIIHTYMDLSKQLNENNWPPTLTEQQRNPSRRYWMQAQAISMTA